MLIREDLRDDFEVDEGVCPVCEGVLFVLSCWAAFVGAVLWVSWS